VCDVELEFRITLRLQVSSYVGDSQPLGNFALAAVENFANSGDRISALATRKFNQVAATTSAKVLPSGSSGFTWESFDRTARTKQQREVGHQDLDWADLFAIAFACRCSD
jgi:hypothetical protein